MSEGGFLAQRPRSPGGLAVVIAMHAAVITALAMSKMDVPFVKVFDPLKIKDVPNDPPPPPPDRIEPKVPQQKSVIETPTPVVVLRPKDNLVIRDPDPVPVPFPTPLPGPDPTVLDKPADPAPPPSKAEPVRTEARIDLRSQLQPAYPPSEQRAENEGSVTVRVLIGTDGRVKAVEKVRAASDAFFRATEEQALRHWRFKPAMVDGKPVESRKTMTVHFRLNG